MGYKDRSAQIEYQRKWMASRRDEGINTRGGCCINCGSAFDLEFHHRDKNDKRDHRFWSWSKERRDSELDKCDLLCAVCHKAETAKQQGYYNYVHGTLTCYKQMRCRCDACRCSNRERVRRQRHPEYARQQLLAA